jgi:O-6-methylguanine DNA methyltransferase
MIIESQKDVLKELKHMSEFEKKVLVATFGIPSGKVSTYKRLAKRIGNEKAFRAVGNALHKNPMPPHVPCHRVVRTDGRVVGDKSSVDVRKNLLRKEGITIIGDRVQLTEDNLY